MKARRHWLRFAISFLVLVVLLFFARAWWLAGLGYALIHEDGPAKADIAVVLAGDPSGNRIVRAGELVRQGYVPAALISGPSGAYGMDESDLAIPFAVRHGFPEQYFIAFPNHSLSTRDEAADVLAELRRRNVKSFLLVTSDYHTARARRLYLAAERQMGGGPQIRTVAAPDEYFHANSWWRSRQGQKVAFMEWSKTLATVVGL